MSYTYTKTASGDKFYNILGKDGVRIAVCDIEEDAKLITSLMNAGEIARAVTAWGINGIATLMNGGKKP